MSLFNGFIFIFKLTLFIFV